MWVIISSIAAFFTTCAFLPQAYKALTKSTKSISVTMYIVLIIGVIFWSAYGFLTNNYAVAIANVIVTISSSIILVSKIKNIVKGVD